LILPFLGLKTIPRLLKTVKGVPMTEWSQHVALHFQGLLQPPNATSSDPLSSTGTDDPPGIFMLRYILNCACLTNTNSLLQIPQLLCRAYARRTARTARESVEAESAWVFSFGYWYAFTMSIFTIGLCVSSAIPSTLPCASLFFFLQHRIDKYNLSHRIFAHGPEIEGDGLLATRVLHYMRCVIAAWWCLMGFSFLFWANNSLDKTESLWCVQAISGLLVASSVALVAWSGYTHQSILHDNQFEVVRMDERGLSKRGGEFRNFFTNIDSVLRYASCASSPRSSRGGYGVIATPLDRLDSGGQDTSPVSMLTDGEPCLSWDATSVVLEPNSDCGRCI